MSTVPATPWLGTESQIEWAERIKPLVSAEFDRVAETLEAVARRQPTTDRLETRAMIAILEEKRLEVLGRNEAGYFIKNWQELTRPGSKAHSRRLAVRGDQTGESSAQGNTRNRSRSPYRFLGRVSKKEIYP